MNQVTVDLGVGVPMRDGTVLRADVYRPATGSWPALVTRTPYAKEQLPALLTAIDPVRAARAGHAVVVQDVRGRYASEGEFRPFDEGADGFDTVEWVAAQPWCDGRVGMFGSSYMAATQLQAAATAPPSLRAICPVEGSSDYFEGRSYRGGAFELGALVTIALWALARGTLQRGDRAAYGTGMAEVRAALGDLATYLGRRPLADLRQTILGAVAPFFFEWAEHDSPDDYWHALSLEHRYRDVAVPGLHTTSWFDQYHVGTLRNFEGLRSCAATGDARDGQALVVGPWAHYVPRTTMLGSVRVGDVDFGLDALVDLEGLQLRWFRQHLREEPGAWRQPTPVRLFVMGANAWRNEETWPVREVLERRLHLAAGGRLAWDTPPPAPPDRYDFDPRHPVPTRGGAHLVLESAFPSGPVDHSSLPPRDDVLVYRSDVLDDDVEIVGWVEASMRVRSSAPSTDFTVKLLDVHPDGRVINVVDGIRRVPGADAPGPSGWVDVRIELGATAIVLPRGHAIEVHVSSSNFPRFDVNPNTGERPFAATATAVARQEVCVGGEHGSYVSLPVRPRGTR